MLVLEPSTDKLKIEVLDEDLYKTDTLGTLTLQVQTLLSACSHPGFCPLPPACALHCPARTPCLLPPPALVFCRPFDGRGRIAAVRTLTARGFQVREFVAVVGWTEKWYTLNGGSGAKVRLGVCYEKIAPEEGPPVSAATT